MMRDLAAVGKLRHARVLLHRDAGEVGDLLAQSGEPVEQGRLAGIGRADQRYRFRRPGSEPAGEEWRRCSRCRQPRFTSGPT